MCMGLGCEQSVCTMECECGTDCRTALLSLTLTLTCAWVRGCVYVCMCVCVCRGVVHRGCEKLVYRIECGWSMLLGWGGVVVFGSELWWGVVGSGVVVVV